MIKCLESVASTPAGDAAVFRLVNSRGAEVELSAVGAGVTRIRVPDRGGRLVDVALGYDDIASYVADSPCAGKTPGRFANRIARAELPLDGSVFRLTPNDGPNTLHGGPGGFHNRIWHAEVTPEGRVKFSRLSPDGEEGYPGNLQVSVTYGWTDDCRLDIEYEAVTDAPTVVNLTNHTYFSLAGARSGRGCLSHLLSIGASRFVETDTADIPTGAVLPVEGTPLDFRTPRPIGERIADDFSNMRAARGYNHYFLLDGYDAAAPSLRPAATLFEPSTGIAMQLLTTLPGVMLYTGNWLHQSPVGRGGIVYAPYEGVALECQFPPDAPHHPSFPQTFLRPGSAWRHTIVYAFSTLPT